jgi:ribosomal protein S18 acetylase RimI-like enzyme
VNVRRARAEDVPTLVRLWREMWDYHAQLDSRYEASPLADTVMTAWIADHLRSERACVLIAEDPDPVGYVSGMLLENPPVLLNQFFGFISEVAVTSSARRRGVGDRLVREMHEWFRLKQVPYVEVNVSVRNAVSRSFWRKQGYTEFLEHLRREL